MRVFQSSGSDLVEAEKVSGRKADEREKAIQSIIESNISVVFRGLEFVATEHQIGRLRPDTIAFDREKRSFVVIEYKNVKNRGIVDQGMSYYNLVRNNRDNLVVLYYESKGRMLSKKKINWDATRVIFISPEFNEHQRYAIQAEGSTIDLPIEMYEMSRYERGIMLLDVIRGGRDSGQGQAAGSGAGGNGRGRGEVKKGRYSEADYLSGRYAPSSPSARAVGLFRDARALIPEAVPGVEAVQQLQYLGFYSKDSCAVCTIELKKDHLKLHYSTTRRGVVPVGPFVEHDVAGNWGPSSHYTSRIRDAGDMDAAMPLIRAVHASKCP